MRPETALRTATALSGYAPAADSPESIRASARCLTTSEISATSARVGVGYSIMDCSRWDATMTGLPCCRHLITISFCTDGTSSRGIWAPASTPCPTLTSSAVLQVSIFCELGSGQGQGQDRGPISPGQQQLQTKGKHCRYQVQKCRPATISEA